jgi:hypothetical protein
LNARALVSTEEKKRKEKEKRERERKKEKRRKLSDEKKLSTFLFFKSCQRGSARCRTTSSPSPPR